MENFQDIRFLVVLLAFAALFGFARATIPGMDVGSPQRDVDWKKAYSQGARFAYVKATEGTSYRNEYFFRQYNGAYNESFLRGAYHFARPDLAGAVQQADYFVQHGGRRVKDGKTLPGAVQLACDNLNTNCSGSPCYGLNPGQMAAWISAFIERYRALSGVYPVLYTNTNWYKQCVGVVVDFSRKCPLWLSCLGCSAIRMPYAWPSYTFLQFSSTGNFSGNQDLFNGNNEQLMRLANSS